MSELIVIAYDTPEKAELPAPSCSAWPGNTSSTWPTAVVATADKDGNVNPMVNLWTVGASGGAFWGLLAGLIFFNPLLASLLASLLAPGWARWPARCRITGSTTPS